MIENLDKAQRKVDDIVAKLWSLCHVLRGGGVNYHQYVTELTYLLFLKMLQETGKNSRLPSIYNWEILVQKTGVEQLSYYRKMLLDLGDDQITEDRVVRMIFGNAATMLKKPANLASLVDNIDKLDWFEAREHGLGNLYEGLLEKNAGERKSGAGQYFTPRPLVEIMVQLMQPEAGEIIQDPAAGTGGFLTSARAKIDPWSLSSEAEMFQRKKAFTGIEIDSEVHRLCLMNLYLHDIEGDGMGAVRLGDTLSPDGERLPKADLVLTNPPFGSKSDGPPQREDFVITSGQVNRQLSFVEHIVRGLKPGGRAAIVLPDGVLSGDNCGRRLREWLMDCCDLHTILKLPTGIFYAQGVKTNVLFLTKGRRETENTKEIWIYDLRSNMPSFGKTTPLTEAHFKDFKQAYGTDKYGKSLRIDEGETGRFRCFSREMIKERNDNLDISWLRDESLGEEDTREPEEILEIIQQELQQAMLEIDAMQGVEEA
ncbi:SAM-dependent methyltransferase [Acetobacteraceae bacterium]|nr:SAM-dependent methyltransferase [Acetobacteraceae bacterium]